MTATTTPAADTATTASCRCGCGEALTRAGATYVRGHDSRHVSQTVAKMTGDPEWDAELVEQLPTPALQAKARKWYARAAERAEAGRPRSASADVMLRRAAREAAKTAAKRAYDVAYAAYLAEHGPAAAPAADTAPATADEPLEVHGEPCPTCHVEMPLTGVCENCPAEAPAAEVEHVETKNERRNRVRREQRAAAKAAAKN